ncbi:MAG: FAD-dependent oxidoreductase, partial [Desulfobacterales bacterium]|nr:FAD-dependent oxidoreductase [Desulfobacterales bacterium]
THSPQDAQVNPITLPLGLILGDRRAGAKILTHTRVLDFKTQGNRITGVTTIQGELEADVTLIAGGALSGVLGQKLDLDFPIRPSRGQIVVTQATRPLISHCMISASYIAAKFDPELAARAGQGISMEQADNGNLLLGSTREFVGFDRKNTREGIKGILRKSAALVPALGELDIIRTFAGLRPFTPDGMPLLGAVAGFEGLYTAAGHEGDGIALSPVTGALMADMILGRSSDLIQRFQGEFDLSAFSPNRFDLKGDGESPREDAHV